MENKALTFLLVVSIIISVGCTFLILDNLSSLPSASITGYATEGTSTTSVNILGAAAVSVEPTTLDFGDIKVSAGFSGANCTFQSTGLAGVDPTILYGGCALPVTNPGFLNITNIGTSNLNISINSTKNATEFFSNYTGDIYAAPPLFQMNVTDTTNFGSCGEGLTGADVLLDLNNSADDPTTPGPAPTVCNYLQPNASFNVINVGLKLSIPVESQATSKTDIINVFAVEA